MEKLKTGDIEKLALSVANNPASPNVDAYLITLGLDEDEMSVVKAQITSAALAIYRPGDTTAPQTIEARWF